MKNWRRNLILGAVFIAPILIVISLPAYGQTADGCPDGPNCIDASNFDSGLDGWSSDGVTTEWLESKTLGVQQADGVMHIYNRHFDIGRSTTLAPGAYKVFYLQPGQYQVIVRGGQDMTLINNSHAVQVRVGTDYWDFSGSFSAWYYSTYTSGLFTIHTPGSVKIQISSEAPSYYDYVWLERLPDNYPTATPFSYGPTSTPGGPTHTPSATPIPTNQQATPVPPGTAVCQAGSPPATAGISDYATATPTPITGTTLSRLETFEYGTIDLIPNWSKTGHISIWNGNDHTGDGSSAVALQYDPHWNENSMASFTHALVLSLDFGYPIWINAWAQADVVPVGGTANLEIWELVGGSWDLVVGATASAQQWYPAHAAISAAATAVAFVAARSDTPTAGYILLDDVYLYAPASNLPYCNGSYPPNTTGIDGNSIRDGLGDTSTLLYPSDKPCPGDIMQPNNLWGMLLAQVTLFLDSQMAWAPAHVLGQTRDLAQQFMLGPVGGLIMLATIILDWNIAVTMMQIYLAFQGGLAVIGIWKTIRRAFIV